MKARNKVTGKVVSNFGWSEKYGMVCYTDEDGNVCHVRRTDEWELLNDVDWDAYRRNVAKDILCAFQMSGYVDRIEKMVNLSIQFADELIKQLQEK